MTGRSHPPLTTLVLVILLTIALSACTTKTVEVTRVKIMERRVIERVVVTVEVTRIHRIVETPKPTLDVLVPSGAGSTPESPSTSSPPTPTPAAPRSTPAATAPPRSSAKDVGERILAAIKDMEQTLLSLTQALNSDPLPRARTIELYDAIRSAPTFTVPEGETELQSIYLRYREQVDYVLGQSTDLYTHLVKIESGEADQTEVSPIHLAMARDAASAGTSALQGLMRELEDYLASQP
jgi:hypothetical protein